MFFIAPKMMGKVAAQQKLAMNRAGGRNKGQVTGCLKRQHSRCPHSREGQRLAFEEWPPCVTPPKVEQDADSRLADLGSRQGVREMH